MDAAHVDLSHAFTPGQGYVGLSRVRNLEGLTIGAGGINAMALKVDAKVLAWDAEVRAASTAAALTVADVAPPRRGSLFDGIEEDPFPILFLESRGLHDGVHEVEIFRVTRGFTGGFMVEFKTGPHSMSSVQDWQFGGLLALCCAIDSNIELDGETIEYIVGVENPMAGQKLRVRRNGEKYTWLPLL